MTNTFPEKNKCPEQKPCPVCVQNTCPPCKKTYIKNYRRGSIEDTDELTKFFTHLSESSSDKDDLNSIYEGSDGEEIKKLPIPQQIELIKETDSKFRNKTDDEILKYIKKFQNKT